MTEKQQALLQELSWRKVNFPAAPVFEDQTQEYTVQYSDGVEQEESGLLVRKQALP